MIGSGENLLPSLMLLFSAVSSFGLGIFVLIRNPWRRTHRMFAVLALNLLLWTVGVFAIMHSHSQDTARFWIQATFVVACFLPAAFYQFIAFFPYQRFSGSRLALALIYIWAAVLALMVHTPLYIRGIQVFPEQAPLVHYGPVFHAYMALICVNMVFCVVNLFRKLRASSGIQRRQVEHVLVSFWVATGLASFTNVLAPVLEVGSLEVYGPCFVVLMMMGLAYSMVRYHLMDIWVIISRTTLYAVIMAFVIATFMGTVSVVHWVFSSGGQASDILTTALAALVIVLVLQPLKERVQLFLDRLVLHRRYDAQALIDRASRSATQFVQLDQLLERVAEDICYTVGVKSLRIVLRSEKEPATLLIEFSSKAEEKGLRLSDHDYLIDYVTKHPEPLVLEELVHGWPSTERIQLAKHLADLDAFLLVPMRTTSGVIGLLALGEKSTRDIYINEDEKVFMTIAGPLATAIENSRLYNKLAQVNLHLERIMSSMRGGVIAVDAVGTITTVNQEAREMLGDLRPGKSLPELEPRVAEILRRTLRDRRGISDVELVITGPNEDTIPVAVSSSCFVTADQESLGAMVLIYNMTQIKRLESNVQRADRLSSIGIMAAGMAHEIKNPLQSIKTFTQLLPARFEDADFRRTFIEVVPPEVQRIDKIVTRLLDFARPKPVRFAQVKLRTIITDVLALVENQVRKAGVHVVTDFPEEIHTITADDQQLHQVFLNLVLNAVSAMDGAPVRELTIRLFYDRAHFTRHGQQALFDVPCVKVVVADTGCGIPKENMDQLFTPFYTTKDDGCGLGLSVVHGMVREHGGEVDVESVVNVGTAFTVTFPLVTKLEMAERVGV
jgi:signal transduction histidine kinase